MSKNVIWISFEPYAVDPLGPCLNILKMVTDYRTEYGIAYIPLADYESIVRQLHTGSIMVAKLEQDRENLNKLIRFANEIFDKELFKYRLLWIQKIDELGLAGGKE